MTKRDTVIFIRYTHQDFRFPSGFYTVYVQDSIHKGAQWCMNLTSNAREWSNSMDVITWSQQIPYQALYNINCCCNLNTSMRALSIRVKQLSCTHLAKTIWRWAGEAKFHTNHSCRHAQPSSLMPWAASSGIEHRTPKVIASDAYSKRITHKQTLTQQTDVSLGLLTANSSHQAAKTFY